MPRAAGLRIQHEFDAHENNDRIPSIQNTTRRYKQSRAQPEVVARSDSLRGLIGLPFFLFTNHDRTHHRSQQRTEDISKGIGIP